VELTWYVRPFCRVKETPHGFPPPLILTLRPLHGSSPVIQARLLPDPSVPYVTAAMAWLARVERMMRVAEWNILGFREKDGVERV
jgi:hypothetical protein